MFEFFLALFGVGYYAHKGLEYNKEKKERNARLNSISNKVQERGNRLQEWKNIVTDRELEELIEYKVYDKSQYESVMSEIREMYSELSEDSMYIRQDLAFHVDMAPVIYGKHTKKESENLVHRDRLFAMRVLMANRGKLLNRDTEGIMQSLWNDDIPAITRRKWHMDEVEFIKWIDKRLKEHGINHDLYTYQWSHPIKNRAHIADDEWIKKSWNYVALAYVWDPYVSFGIDEVIN